MTERKKIKVAIVGGGLGGLVLFKALTKHSQFEVDIYEAGPEFSERGASVGLSRNAKRVVDLLGLRPIVDAAEGVETLGFRNVMGEGPEAGTIIWDQNNPLITVSRPGFLKGLLGAVPHERMHVSKKLETINSGILHFVDGTTASADVIIGADGIHSRVRATILGADHPATAPLFAGFWDCRNVVPVEKAMEKLGSGLIQPDKPREHMWYGDGSILFLDYLDNGKAICVVGGGRTDEDWDKTEWRRPITREWMTERYKNWGAMGKGFVDLLLDQPEPFAFMQWESGLAPTYCKNSICMIGDAAHAPTPWQGSGLGQTLEDVLVLDAVLGRCQHITDVPVAFYAYDAVRRSRTQKIIKSSAEVGLWCTGACGLDIELLRKEMPWRWEHILTIDLPAHVAEAVRIFEDKTKGTN